MTVDRVEAAAAELAKCTNDAFTTRTIRMFASQALAAADSVEAPIAKRLADALAEIPSCDPELGNVCRWCARIYALLAEWEATS